MIETVRASEFALLAYVDGTNALNDVTVSIAIMIS